MIQQTSLSAFNDVSLMLGERQKQVLDALQELGDANNLMIAKKIGIPINSVTPRVLELRKARLVEISYQDVCPFTGRRTIFWRLRR